MAGVHRGTIGGNHGCAGRGHGRRAVDRHRRAELLPGAGVPRRRRHQAGVAHEPRRRPLVRLGVGGGHGRRSVHGHVAVPRRDVGQQAIGRPRAEAARGPPRHAGADRRRPTCSSPTTRRRPSAPSASVPTTSPPSTRGLVYVALPGFGSDPDQPYYEFLAWGPNQAPLVGLDELTGYPDQVPAGIATIAPPDYFAGLHAIAAVLTALEHRDRTGEGTVVDIAQFETTVSSLGPFLLDHALSGAVPGRVREPAGVAGPAGLLPLRRRRRLGGRHRRRRRAVGGAGRPARRRRARRPLRHAGRARRAPRRARRADRGVDVRRSARRRRRRAAGRRRRRVRGRTTTPACSPTRRSATGSGSSCSRRAASRTATCSAVTRSASVPSRAGGGGPVRRWARTPAPVLVERAGMSERRGRCPDRVRCGVHRGRAGRSRCAARTSTRRRRRSGSSPEPTWSAA